MRIINRDIYDYRLLALSFERCLSQLCKKGFVSSLLLPEDNDGVLLLRYKGPFVIDIERDDRLDLGVYCYSEKVDKPLSIKRIGLSRLIFLLSDSKENMTYMFYNFWDPWDYAKSAELISEKLLDYYEKIEWIMKEENSELLYRRIKETGKDFMLSIGSR